MLLYKTSKGAVLLRDEIYYRLVQDWDVLINQPQLFTHLQTLCEKATVLPAVQGREHINNYLLPPIGTQEVWAAGVTYLRSRDARMDESKDAGAADCYSKVYDAERPELFFKAAPQRVAGHLAAVYIRPDSAWNVPEPELTLLLDSSGGIQAFTIGNDMSSRSIEGENPLYLPQAKMWERSAALGPCLLVAEKSIPPASVISMQIVRSSQTIYEASTPISRMKRALPDLARYLFAALEFPHGCFLMTGTCLVPPNNFTLQPGDVVSISITGIGTLINHVALYQKMARGSMGF